MFLGVLPYRCLTIFPNLVLQSFTFQESGTQHISTPEEPGNPHSIWNVMAPKSQNQRMAELGWDPWRSSGPTYPAEAVPHGTSCPGLFQQLFSAWTHCLWRRGRESEERNNFIPTSKSLLENLHNGLSMTMVSDTKTAWSWQSHVLCVCWKANIIE